MKLDGAVPDPAKVRAGRTQTKPEFGVFTPVVFEIFVEAVHFYQ